MVWVILDSNEIFDFVNFLTGQLSKSSVKIHNK
ncbi:hypothetical protein J2T02_000897 [Chitinophaga terrae (ex Kim and Jung 2007)]|nr:hypothetical protein [Chitinophaga terrae (ex Kim and Jung 2007)]